MTVRVSGFTLIEVAVALFIVALLLGSLLVPISVQVEQRQRAEVRQTMDMVLDALAGFAAANGHLPCPDQMSGAGANDGVEDVNTTTGSCSVVSGTSPSRFSAGNLPWVTLGFAPYDAWGNRYRYAVLEDFGERATGSGSLPTLSSHSTGGLRMCPTAACSTTLSATAVAVIVSHGRNGYGAMNATTGTVNPYPGSGSADEIDNSTPDRDFVWRTPTDADSGNEFDDLVTWLSRRTLFHRMVSAGRLP